MFYRKRLITKPAKKMRVRLPVFYGIDDTLDESALPKQFAVSAYNYKYDGGALKTGIGVKSAVLPLADTGLNFPINAISGKGIAQLWHYTRKNTATGIADDRLVAVTYDGMLYQKTCDNSAFARVGTAILPTASDALNYNYNGEDILLISSKSAGLWMYDGSTLTQCVNAPKVSSMCVHYERIFAAVADDNNSVWFSDDFDPANWNVSLNEAGFISFADEGGAVRKVIQFLDSVYIFRDYAIHRLVGYGEQTEFSVSKVANLTGRIYPATVKLCGEMAYFLASDGIYSFDGFSVRKAYKHICKRIDPMQRNAHACFLGGKYYLALKMSYGDGKNIGMESISSVNNTLSVIDLSTGIIDFIRGIDVQAMTAAKLYYAEKILLTLNYLSGHVHFGKIGEFSRDAALYGSPLPMNWTGAYSSMNYPDADKTVRSLSLCSKYPAVLTVTADGETHCYDIAGGGSPVTVLINKKCRKFGIAISGEGQAEIVDGILFVDIV